MQNLNHKHIVVTAYNLKNPPKTSFEVERWLLKLVDAVNMKVLLGPFCTRCDTPGNEGVTGIVCIETSHASIHVWDNRQEPYAQMDLYSCDDFDTKAVFELLKEFKPFRIDGIVIDRNLVDDPCSITVHPDHSDIEKFTVIPNCDIS
jgi:S-adenosylmethionine/arginine decarboxylase-like enzyme